jgi:O-antigen/teichoic acid export membrane protein
VKLFYRYKDNETLKKIIIVLSGTAAAQVINLLFTPVITRIFGPDAYGEFGSYMAVLGILGPISALCYPKAIVMARSLEDVRSLIAGSIYVSLLFSLITLLPVSVFFILYSIPSFYFILPIGIVFYVLYETSEQLEIRRESFKIISKVYLLQALILSTLKIIIGENFPSGYTLVLLHSFGYLVFFILFSFNKKFIFHKFSVDKLKEYNEFPKYRAPQVLINSLSQSLPVLMLAVFFGSSMAGYYALSKTVVGVPVSMLSRAIGSVYYPKIAVMYNNGFSFYSTLKKVTFFLFLLGLPLVLILIISGEDIFILFFGSEWGMSGRFSGYISIWLYGAFISSSVTQAIPMLGLQKQFLMYTIALTICRAVVIYLGFLVMGVEESILLFSLVGFAFNIMLTIYVLLVCKSAGGRL